MALDDDKSETSDADLAETFDDDLLTPSDQAVLEPADMAKSKSPWRAPILLAIGIVIADQLTKHWAVNRLADGTEKT